MKADSFWNLIPKGVKVAAAIVFACALITGPIIGASQAHMAGAAIGLGIGLLGGTFLGFWLLCLGYVYADARRRAMRAILWVLIAIFVPNLLGFLLYFAIRRPLGSTCASCGNLIAAEHRFCSWCGSQSFAPPAPGGLQSPGSGAEPATHV